MKNIIRVAAFALLSAPLLLVSCKKIGEDAKLEGAVPAAGFTATVSTSQFPVVVTFKNTSSDAFLSSWDFGDGTASTSFDAVHTYQRGGTYKVKLTTAGRGGSNVTSQDVVVPSPCTNAGFSALTACTGNGSTSWTISDQPNAIVRLAANGTTVLSSTAGSQLNACQLDDVFSFGSNYTYSYDAGGPTGKTYSNGTCGTALKPNSSFTYKPNAGLGQIVLLTNRSFIGLTDSVVNKTYDILEASATRLRLRGTNPDGTFTVITYMPQVSDIDRVKQLLTGGSSRTWMLDNAANHPIIVGPSDTDTTSYYAGGPAGSLKPCQADDEYTFTTANAFVYDAKAETLVALYPLPDACQAPRSLTTTYSLGAASGVGRAQIELGNPRAFIGITDSPSRTYRILSIDNRHMLVRAGSNSAGITWTIKLVAK